MPSPSPTPFDVVAWRDGIEASLASGLASIQSGVEYTQLGIFALVLLGGLAVALLTGLVVLGVRGHG